MGSNFQVFAEIIGCPTKKITMKVNLNLSLPVKLKDLMDFIDYTSRYNAIYLDYMWSRPYQYISTFNPF